MSGLLSGLLSRLLSGGSVSSGRLFAICLLACGWLACGCFGSGFWSHSGFCGSCLSGGRGLFQGIQHLFNLFSPCRKSLLGSFQIALSLQRLRVGGRVLGLCGLLCGLGFRSPQLLFGRCGFLRGSLLNILSRLLQSLDRKSTRLNSSHT